jgi:hypothetical protein
VHHKQKEYHINGLADIFPLKTRLHPVFLCISEKPETDAFFAETFFPN